jgi:hypothetical protein
MVLKICSLALKLASTLNFEMFGPLFVIIAFIICLFLTSMACRFGGHCDQLHFGVNATIGIIIFLVVIYLLKGQLGGL